MFTQDLDGVFDKMVDTVYKETSQHLLNVLHTKYKFMDHLKVCFNQIFVNFDLLCFYLMFITSLELFIP
jgi:hypothetical protein